MLAPSDRTDLHEEMDKDNELAHLHSCRKHVPSDIDIRMDLLKDDEFRRSSNESEDRTFATSSPILTNGPNFFIRELNDVTSFW